ncbi:hypothetical protein V8C37DRAFT_332138 [Trichoderma ceciliae]
MFHPQHHMMGIPSYQESVGPSIGSPMGPFATASGAAYGYTPLLPTPSTFTMPMNMSTPPYPYHVGANGYQTSSADSSGFGQSQVQTPGAGTVSQTPRQIRRSNIKALAPHFTGRVIKRTSVKTSSRSKGSRMNPIVAEATTFDAITKHPLRADPKDNTKIGTSTVIPKAISTHISKTAYQVTPKTFDTTATIIIDDSEERDKEKIKVNNTNLQMGTITAATASVPQGITSDRLKKLLSSQHWETFHKIPLTLLVEIMADQDGDGYSTWQRRLARHLGHRETYGIYEVDGFLYEVDKSTGEALPIEKREYDGHHVRLHEKCYGSETKPWPAGGNGKVLAGSNGSFLDLWDKNDDLLPPDSRAEMTAGELLDCLEKDYSLLFHEEGEGPMWYTETCHLG